LEIVLAGLVGAITWNLITWYLGLPSSSSHALIGGMVGSAAAADGFGVIKWGGLKEKVLIPSLLAPIIGALLAAALMIVVLWIIRNRAPGLVNRVFRRLQLVSGGFVAFTHGTNDAQKTMGIMALALVASGHLSPALDQRDLSKERAGRRPDHDDERPERRARSVPEPVRLPRGADARSAWLWLRDRYRRPYRHELPRRRGRGQD
jgi:phosphate/sulfate permease